jgi:DNA-binding transcriptional MerR regulator
MAEMTGIAAATLRAWERRYGIPTPARSSSAYRLYSDRDVEAVKRLVAHRAEGLSTAEAAEAVSRWLETESQAVAEQSLDDISAYVQLRESLYASVRDFDYQALERSVSRLLFVGNATTIFERVLAPLQVQVGQAWHDGLISVGQEHMATELLESAARDLLRLLEIPTDARDLLLACYPEEEHSLPLFGVAYRAVRSGLRPIVLGSRTPPSAIAAAVSVRPVAAVGLSLTIPTAPHVVRSHTEDFVRAAGSVPVIVGGSGVRSAREIILAAGAHVIDGSGAGAAEELISVIRESR